MRPLALLILLLPVALKAEVPPPIEGDLGTNRGTEGDADTAHATHQMVLLPDALPDSFDGAIPITNRHSDRSLDQVLFTWKLLKFPPAGADASAFTSAIGKVHLPGVQPKSEGLLKLNLPAILKDADALQVLVNEFNGRLLSSRTWPLKPRRELLHAPAAPPATPPADLLSEDPLRVRCGDTVFTFSATTGRLSGIAIAGRQSGLANGPRPVTQVPGKRPSTSVLPDAPVVSVRDSDQRVIITSRSGSDQNLFRWIVHPGGRLQLDYRFARAPGHPHRAGVAFDLSSTPASKRWLGADPELGLRHDTSKDAEFHGTFRDPLWMTLDLANAAVTIIPSSPDTTIGLLPPVTAADPPSALAPGLLFFDDIAPPPADGPVTGSFVFHIRPAADPGP
jgi:hypothetical protein